MKEYIDKEKLYNLIAEKEEIARQRYLDTPWDSLARTRYQAQLNERTELKHLIVDMQAEDVAPVVHGKWRGYIGGAFHGCDEFGDPIYRDVAIYICHKCGRRTVIKENYCPKCGAKMDLEE